MGYNAPSPVIPASANAVTPPVPTIRNPAQSTLGGPTASKSAQLQTMLDRGQPAAMPVAQRTAAQNAQNAQYRPATGSTMTPARQAMGTYNIYSAQEPNRRGVASAFGASVVPTSGGAPMPAWGTNVATQQGPAMRGTPAQAPVAQRYTPATASTMVPAQVAMQRQKIEQETGYSYQWHVAAAKNTGEAFHAAASGQTPLEQGLPEFLSVGMQSTLGIGTTELYAAGYDVAFDDAGVPYWYRTERGGSASAAGGYASATNARYRTSSGGGSGSSRSTGGAYIGGGMLINWRI